MIRLPELGEKVKVWPRPGRRAHANDRPVDRIGGGRFLASDGEEVIWGPWHAEQLRSGDLLLHCPISESAKEQ